MVLGILTPLTAAFAIKPAMTTIPICPSPTRPIPTTLPVRSCRGRTAASKTSAVREVFSCATPLATADA